MMTKKISVAAILALVSLQTNQVLAQTTMDKFVGSLMAKMTLSEKIGQLNQEAVSDGVVTGASLQTGVNAKIQAGSVGSTFGIVGAAKLRKLQELAVTQSRLKIPLLFALDVIHGHRTVFPIPLGLSCSWDLSLIQQSAAVAGKEASAEGLKWVFSPMVDIVRDPRWGRVSESSGEDPFLGSLIAKAMVRGYQGKSIANDTSVAACVKHFALYGGAEAGREYNTVDMSPIRMYNDYLPPYKAAVDAGVATIMTSFNTVNDLPSTANKWLLTDLLRKQWGFNGLVVSDYTAVSELLEHRVGADLQEVSAKALNAGLDMDMVSEGFLTTLEKSVKSGLVSSAAIDTACRRVLELKYKLGLFNDPYRSLDSTREPKDILSKENRAFARKIAAHSFVLLKNDNNVLPLATNKKIALVGPLADSKRNMLGTWSVAGDPEKSVSVLEGMQAAFGANNIMYAKGANISDDTSFAKKINVFGNGEEITIDKKSPESLIADAVNAAQSADVVVAVVGEAADMSGESSSLSDIHITESQRKLLKALKQTGKPLLLVLFNGRPLTLEWEKENAAAILDCWSGGTEAGNAVADVLTGKYNPSGKLTMTFPRSVGQIPIYYNHKNTGRPYEEGGPTKFKSDYLDISNDPLFPFGFGLSYSTFRYDNIRVDNVHPHGNQNVSVSVDVKNTSQVAGEETVQLYISDLVASVSRPVKELKGFQKIYLKAGESKKVQFIINPESISFYNDALQYGWEPGKFDIQVGGNSLDTQSVTVDWSK